MKLKRGECVIRFGGFYTRGHDVKGVSLYCMTLYQEQYIVQICHVFLVDIQCMVTLCVLFGQMTFSLPGVLPSVTNLYHISSSF